MTSENHIRATPSQNAGRRGPAEHARREQIIEAANEHFRHYGYAKTTVADLAKVIGLSTAYIYKFFDSKRAIGEAVCALCLMAIDADLRVIVEEDASASDKLRRYFKELSRSGVELFFHERKLHDIVVAAMEERWQSVDDHKRVMVELLQRIVRDGREAGEFERKTPLDETCQAILLALEPVCHPLLLEQHLDTLEADVSALTNLVLRSLAP
jgi:AcrR family transcriptional regulator